MTKLNYRNLHPAIGAEILDIDLSQPLDPEVAAEMLALWEDRSVLVFRNQDLSPQDQLRVTGYFGEVREVFFKNAEGRDNNPDSHPAIAVISNLKLDGKPIGTAGDGELWFHSDHCYLERSGGASLLYGLETTSEGGDTLFASGYEAYRQLSPELKKKLDGVNVDFIFDRELNQLARLHPPRPEHSQHAVHPAIVKHPKTGRPSLFVNRLMGSRLIGFDEAESNTLLEELFDYQEQDRFTYRHKWQDKDLVVWDNRSCLHSRTWFDPNLRRAMRRTATQGQKLEAASLSAVPA